MALPQEGSPSAQAQDPRTNREHELGHIGARDRPRPVKARRCPGVRRGVDPVQDERVEVWHQPRLGSECCTNAEKRRWKAATWPERN
jgi:hypothetical protein